MPLSEVRLDFYHSGHLEKLERFQLPEEQVQFTSLPIEIMNIAEGQYRIVILHDKEPVGFFLLNATEKVKEYTDNRNAMLLASLSVNHVYQGRGLAKQGMRQLKCFVQQYFPTCDEVVLAVNFKNIVAQKLYTNVGFKDTGRRITGPIGEQYVMSLVI